MSNTKQLNRMSISTFIISAVITLGVLITAASCVIGYYRYTNVLEKSYNDKAYDIAYSAIATIDGDLIENWFNQIYAAGDDADVLAKVSKDIQANPEYQKILANVQVLRDNMSANYIYLADMMGNDGKVINTLTYLMDADNPDDKFPPFVPGEYGPMNPDFLADAQDIYDTGLRSTNYFYSHSDFGYNTSAIAAIKNSDGKVIAILGVELAMSTLQEARLQFIIFMVIATLMLMAIFVAIDVLLIRKYIIKPLHVVIDETNDFVNKEASFSDKLAQIKTGNEIETLAGAILTMEKDIKDYITNLTAITAEKERISAELDVATNIQASMLPSSFPAYPNRDEFDVYATMDPAKEVGGDFYDFFMIDEKHLAIVCADVSGKGVPAALFMVIGKTLLKDHTDANCDLGQVFTEVNNILCQANDEGLFITAFEGILDLETGEFRFVNAGHETPFIYSQNGDFKPYAVKAAFVLAGMEDIPYRSGVIQLNEGDKIFQYTDGVTEATNANNELYGMERLENILNEVKEKAPSEILPAVKADIDKFVGEAPQFDDITMICVDFKKKMTPKTE